MRRLFFKATDLQAQKVFIPYLEVGAVVVDVVVVLAAVEGEHAAHAET